MKSIAVIGVGLIGGSIGLAARRAYSELEVKGYDPAPGVLERASEIGAISSPCSTIDEAVAGATGCFIACPVSALPEVVNEALDVSSKECFVTDVGSTKKEVVSSLATGRLERFIGGHPLAGAEAAGVEHARAELFNDAVWYLTPTKETSGVLYERLHRLIADLGARPQAIEAETHDRLLATVSHLPHVLANILVDQAAQTLSEEQERLPAVGPSFRDMTRIAGSNPGIWADIFMANRDAVAAESEEHARRLQEIASALRSGDRSEVDRWICSARENRRQLLEPALDGGAVCQLRISVPNKPGVVAAVALELGKAGVNIVDMALHPAADMSSGAITLWIAGDPQSTRAEELIAGLGYPVARI